MIMENKDINGLDELEELRGEYASTKECFDNEPITNAHAVEKSIRYGMNELKLAKRKWILLSIGGMTAFIFAIAFVYGIMPNHTVLLISTGAIILLYAATIFITNTSRLERLYDKDSVAFVRSVRRQQKLQYWFMRIYLVAFCFWAGFMITVPFVRLDSVAEKVAFLVVLVLFLGINLFTTIRMHNSVIGSYEGLLFDDAAMRTRMVESYYTEEAIRERQYKTAKRKYALCISMIICMAALFLWQLVRVLRGGGIASTLPIYPIFIVVFINLAIANKKDMNK